MLDGVHMDLLGNVVLSAIAGIQCAHIRQKRMHLQAELGRYGRVRYDIGHPDTRTQCHINRSQLRLHLHHDASTEIGCAHP